MWTREHGWVSECYGEKKEAPVFAFTVLANGSEELVTFLLPEIAGRLKPKVREIEALNGRAFEIDVEGRHDVLLLQTCLEDARRLKQHDSSRISTSPGQGSNEQTLGTPEELIVINGHTLQFEGRDLLKSTKKINYATVMPQMHADARGSDQSVFIQVDPRLKSKSLCAELTE